MAQPDELLTNEQREANTVLIGIPHTGTATYHHFLSLVACSIPFTRHYSCKSGYPLDIARNLIVTDMLQQHAGWLFFVDSDIRLRPDTFQTLYDSHLPIISASYVTRAPPFTICARVNNEYLDAEMFKRDHRFYQVHEVGMGCCLIDRRVFQRISRRLDKWYCLADHTRDAKVYTLTYSDKDATALNWKCSKCNNTLICPFFKNMMGSAEVGMGEDFHFCKLARETGFDIYLSNGAVVDHEPHSGDWVVNDQGAVTTVVNAGLV